MKDYDYLSLIVEISPQTLRCASDIDDYEKVLQMNANGDFQGIFNYMMQWEYYEDTSDTQDNLDKYEKPILETDRHILARCDSKNFGWQGDAFFLYRKDKMS